MRKPFDTQSVPGESARPGLTQRRGYWITGLIAVLMAALAGGFFIGRGMGSSGLVAEHTAVTATKYHCPMHPTIISDKPGDCPICGMRLVPFEETTSETPGPGEKPGKKVMYRSTMNPNEVSDKPGKDSMGMDMVPTDVENGAASESESNNEPVRSTVPGFSVVSIPPDARSRMGLTLGTITRMPFDREVRTSAEIVADETRLFQVTTKTEGWVNTLFINITGQTVGKGDPLLTIYSPELVSAEEEYLNALRTKERVSSSTDPHAVASGATLFEAARQRLHLWDISSDQIDRLEKTGQAEKYLTLYAPAAGIVVEKNVLPGDKIMPGSPLMVVADLSVVWGDADIYPSDLPSVKVGMPLEMTLPYLPGKVFQGKVIFVSPTLDTQTRTMQARLEIPNPDQLLKPGMFGDARFSYALGTKLVIPESAVMLGGEHVYAFRDLGDGHIVPTAITIGARSDGYYELLEGLSEGDSVVTSANFLVDSESSLKAALEGMTGNAAHQE
jgi:Cu(I)/Ag(I) efflux system membrane fusion protein